MPVDLGGSKKVSSASRPPHLSACYSLQFGVAYSASPLKHLRQRTEASIRTTIGGTYLSYGFICTWTASAAPASENQAQDDANHAHGCRPASCSSLGLHLLRLSTLLNRLLPNSQGPVYVPCLALSWTEPCSGCSSSERFQSRGPSPGKREQPSGTSLHERADGYFDLQLPTHESSVPSHPTRKA